MKNAFSMHSLHNDNKSDTTNSFYLSTINDTQDITNHFQDNSLPFSLNTIKTSPLSNNQILPVCLDTIELRESLTQSDFYQTTFDWCHLKTTAAIVDGNTIHLTNFKVPE